MSNAIASKSVSLASIFDPYVAGTIKARASGIDDAGNDTSNLYANIIYGSAAAATGIASQGADLNTLYAAKGTASYALPIDGETFTGSVTVTTGTKASSIAFSIVGGNTYQVSGASNTGTQILASGPVPTGAVTVKYTFGTYTVPSGSDAGGSTTNGAGSATAVSGNPGASYVTSSWGSSTGTHERQYPFTIDFYNSSGANISHTSIFLAAIVEPAT